METPNRRKAVLFGLNYESNPTAKLSGCINDVQMMGTMLREKMKFDVDIYTDDKSPHDCSALGIISRLYEVAIQSWRDSLQYVYIHYSGHGSYVQDTNGDEKDKQDKEDAYEKEQELSEKEEFAHIRVKNFTVLSI